MSRMKLETFGDAEARNRLTDVVRGWSVEDGWLVRRYETGGWPATMLLVGQIAFLAEAANHHPDLEVRWGGVTVRLRTHDADGITEKDFELARRIEECSLWRPASGSALATTPGDLTIRGGREA